MEYETTLHHLQTTILLKLHSLLHFTTWLPSLIISANFKLLFDLFFCHFIILPWKFVFAIDLNPYNSYFFILNSSQIFLTNFKYVV